jgi:hypothetical protein
MTLKIKYKDVGKNSEIHIHSSCQNSNVHGQFCRMNVAEKDVMNVEIRLFNKLPSQTWKVVKIQ